MKCQKKGKLIAERELQRDCLVRLQTVGDMPVGHEVPLLGRFVDLVYIRGNHVVTVEFKLHDWRKGIEQARDHLLGADYAYICMPRKQISDTLKRELKDAGIGLVFYKEDTPWPFEKVIGASRSRETWSVARSMLVDYVTGRRGTHE